MATLEITLPEPLRDFMNAQVENGAYASPSAYVESLLQAAQRDADAAQGLEYSEPVNIDFIAELRAADEETKRVGTIPFEEVAQRMEQGDGPDFLARVRARIADYKSSEAHTRFETSKAAHKAALLREREVGGAV